MNTQSIALQLFLLAKMKPEMWDVIVPMGPVLSKGTQAVFAGQVIKSVASQTADHDLKKELLSLAKDVYNSGRESMSFDDDDFCLTPYPHHFDLGGWFNFLNPQPLPPMPIVSHLLNPQPLAPMPKFDRLNPQPLPPIYIKAMLYLVAESTGNSKIAARLHEISAALTT